MTEFHDDFFKTKLYNAEAEYSENVSFDKVMERRKKKRRFVFWWNPKVYITTGVLFLGGLTAFIASSFENNNRYDVSHNLTDSRNIEHSYKKATNLAESKKQISTIAQNNSEKLNIKNASSLNIIGNNRGEIKRSTNHQLGKSSFQLFTAKRKRINQNGKNNADIIGSIGIGQNLLNANVSSLIESDQKGYAKNPNWSSEDIWNLTKWNDKLNSAPLRDKHFGFEGLNLEYPELNFELPEFNISLKKTPSKWFAELSAITGSNNTIVFEDNVPLSILGTQYMAQYQLLAMKDFQNGSMFGAGVQFSEWVGNGKWQKTENVVVTKVTNRRILISMIGMPKKYAYVSDTTYEVNTNVQTGMIDYTIDKISFPLAYRFCTSIGKMPVRLGVHLAPGYTTLTKGIYFNTTDYQPLEKTRQLTVDGRISLGPMFPITKNWTFVIEPSLIYQSFITPDAQVNGKFFTGLGVAILRQF